MGAHQSSVTKNTFIDVDTRGVDGSIKDPRKVKSWGAPAAVQPHRADDSLDSDVTKTPDEDETASRIESDNEWGSDEINRLKTFDPAELPLSSTKTCDPMDVPTHATGFDFAQEALSSTKTYDPMDSPRAMACRTMYSQPTVVAQPVFVPVVRPVARETGSVAEVAAAQTTHDGKASFWDSWNLGSSAKKALQERANRSAGVGLSSDHSIAPAMLWNGDATEVVAGASAQTANGAFKQIRVPKGREVSATADQQRAVKTEDQDQDKKTSSASSQAKKVVESADQSTWTSRMIKNIPNDYKRQDVLDLLDSRGLEYDFVYVPIDWCKRANLGYAFVNLVSNEEAVRIEAVLNDFSDWTVPSEKTCEVVWGKPEQQSLCGNIERFRNSPVMHPDVPEEFKPLLFTLGKRAVFPAPTKRIRPPRGLNRRSADAEQSASLQEDSDEI